MGSLIPLGFWAASKPGGGSAASDYELISTTILGSSTASVTFSGLGTSAAAYKHLQIRGVAMATGGSNDNIDLTFNGDTGSNYSYHALYGTGSAAGSEANTPRVNIAAVMTVVGTSTAANQFSASVIDILDFASTSKNKTVRSFAGRPAQSPLQYLGLHSGAWFSTSAVTSITLTMRSQTILAGSRFSLYGLKG